MHESGSDLTEPSAPILLTPNSKAFASELSLARIDSTMSAVAWIERDGGKETICWRLIQPEGVGPVESISPIRGAPGQPKVCGHLLIWNEFHDGEGVICYLPLNSRPPGKPRVIESLKGLNCGDFACSQEPDGRVWIVLEARESDSANIWRHHYENGAWNFDGGVESGDSYLSRPDVFASGTGLIASYDEYIDAEFRVATEIFGTHDEEFDEVLPSPAGTWETFATVCLDDEEICYAARNRDRLVHLEDGIAGYHSELVVSTRLPGAAGEWVDVACVNIDHGMNPWMAPYCGNRRRPHLVPRKKGAWLLWEEKEDVKGMDPPWGRLCAVEVDPIGLKSEPMVVLDKVSMVVVEGDAEGDNILVATRTRESAWQNRIPYHLHHLRLDQLDVKRPTDLETNGEREKFEIRETVESQPSVQPQGMRLYFGDPHIHSWWSQDLDGEQDELYLFGRDISKLDFIAFTENDFHWYSAETFSKAMWQRNRRNAEFFNQPGEFTVLLGWEFTKRGNPKLGDKHTSHRCVLYPGTEGAVDCWYESETPDPASLVRKLAGQRVLLHHHHLGPFDLTDDSLERNIEICSGWWNCMEKPDFVDKLHEMLGRGLRTGFFGGSDNHERTPGIGGALTGVWATENTREGIFDAFWNRRVFATTGLRPDLRFMVSGTFMGGEASVSDPPEVSLHVQCESRIRKAEILRDGEIVHTEAGGDEDLDLHWVDNKCAAGSHYYYAHVLFEGHESNPHWNISSAYGVHAWSSPVWIQFE